MRENRTYGSEGGGAELNRSFLPLSTNLHCLSAEYFGKAVARQKRNDANVCDARGSNPDGPEVHLTANLHCLSAEHCGSAGLSWMEFAVEMGWFRNEIQVPEGLVNW